MSTREQVERLILAPGNARGWPTLRRPAPGRAVGEGADGSARGRARSPEME